MGCHALLQGIFPTQGSNPCLLCLLHWQAVFFFFFFFLPLAPPENPVNTSIITKLSFLWWKHLRSTLSNFGQHIKKQRHYFADKGLSTQSYGFPSSRVWIWELDYKESWAWRIDAFELWCWRRVLRVPWTARRSNRPSWRKSVLNIHWKDWCSSWNSNTLATWCEELTHWKRPWCWERLKMGGEGDKEDEMVGWHHQLNGHEFE